MADASYDAVVVGGGQHGLILGCYLQNAGMATAIFERQYELGGGLCGDEVPLPGFLANTCAHWTRFYSHPAYEDFNLRELGVHYVFPECGQGMIFDNGTCLVGYVAEKVVDETTGRSEFSAENAERNIAEIARFSARDAETAREIIDRWNRKWARAWAEYHYNPPAPWGVKNPIEKLLDDPQDGIDPVYQFMTIWQQAYDLFESDEMRTYLMRSAQGCGGCMYNDTIGVDQYLLAISLILSLRATAVVIGGSHAIAHALQRAFTAKGGKFLVSSEVDKIIIENGRAKGIRLVDGTAIEANKLVACDVDVTQMILRLIGEEHVSSRIARRARNISYMRGAALWTNVAIYEPPEYKAVEFNPDCQYLPRLWLGPIDPEYMVKKFEAEAYTRGFPSKLYMNTGMDSLWDRTRAPQGKHMVLVEQYCAPTSLFTEREWLKIKKEYADELIRQWQWYAPNMTGDNVIAIDVQTPYDYQQRLINMPEGSWQLGSPLASQMGRFRPFPELSGYRMPIKNLYLCSAATHYAGGIGRSSSYNCFKVIAEDFDLEKIWEKQGRPW